MKFSKDFIYLGIILLMGLLGYFFLYKPLDKLNYKYDIEVVKKEERIKELEKQILEKDSLSTIIEKERDSALTVIKNRKENIKYIYKNYDKKIDEISNLNTDNSIVFFKSWINSK